MSVSVSFVQTLHRLRRRAQLVVVKVQKSLRSVQVGPKASGPGSALCSRRAFRSFSTAYLLGHPRRVHVGQQEAFDLGLRPHGFRHATKSPLHKFKCAALSQALPESSSAS